VVARFSAPVQTGPGAYPASCTMGTGSFPGIKRPERGVDHPPPSSAKVKERVELYLYSPSGPTWPVLGKTLPYLFLRRRRKQLLNDLKEERICWKLKEEALDRTLWRTRFGRGYGPVVRQSTE
jgi:hypothetical protein